MASYSDSDVSMSSSLSATSSTRWRHEPFETFQVKALALAQELFSGLGVVAVEHIRGGANNRVIGININGQRKFILRVPREPDCADIPGDAACFIFVQWNARIQCPKVVTFSTEEDNAIGSPFVVHSHVQGDSLCPSWWQKVGPGANEKKLKVAHQMGLAVRKMLETRNDSPGFPAFAAGRTRPGDPVLIESFCLTSAAPFMGRSLAGDREWQPTTGRPAITVATFMSGVYQAHKRELAKESPLTTRTVQCIDALTGLQTMVSHMATLEVFVQVGYSLYHHDIAPRNVMADWTSEEVTLTILDWDDVCFMPSFMAASPQPWLWEKSLNSVDSFEDDLRQRKEVFEAAAGPEYARYARLQQVYDFARDMMHFVLERTVHNTETLAKARNLLLRWDAFVQKHGLAARAAQLAARLQ